MYQVGDAVDTTEGSAVVQKVYPDGELALSFPEYTTPDELFTMAPVDVSPCTTRPRRSSHRTSKPVVNVPQSTTSQKKTKKKKKKKKKKKSKTVVEPPHAKRQRSSRRQEDVARPTKRPRSNAAYTKDLTSTVSKTEQNTAFVAYLRSLGLPMKSISVLVLDTRMLRTTRMLLAAGLMPSHIYIPQPDKVEAAHMLKECPTLRVSAGLKAGDLIWKMAGRGTRLHGALLDYCGMPGDVGIKNTPVDDMDNLLRYNVLQDQAVVT